MGSGYRETITFVYAYATKLQFKICNPDEVIVSIYRHGGRDSCYNFTNTSFNHVKNNGIGVAIAIK